MVSLKQSPEFIKLLNFFGRTLEEQTLALINSGEHLERNQGRVQSTKWFMDQLLNAEKALKEGHR